MSTFFQLLFSGLALGAIYALIALGFVVIYRSSQVFNFAHGEFLTLGAYSMVSLCKIGLPWGLALIGSMLITGLIAAIIEKTVLRPLVGRPVFVTIILTIFLGYILHAGVVGFWGTDPVDMPTPWDNTRTFQLFGAYIQLKSIITIAVGLLALLLFFLMFRFSRMGIGMRAASNDQEAALSLGMPIGRIFGATWFLAGMYAALAGVFVSVSSTPSYVEHDIGYIALRAFPVVIVGGLESASGAVIAGFLLGVVELLAQGYLNPNLGEFGKNFHVVFPYLVMLIFLIFRPYGIFGRKEVERV